ncbi:hypothetical protein LDENG_00046480, partial [Lucifuga dentata]
MGHLGALFLLIAPLTCQFIWGHDLPACKQQLEFKCSDGRIPRISMCDGQADGKDGSDELHCGYLGCKKDEFACHNRHCISRHFLCNGVDNCGDGSDEASCQNCTTDSFSFGPSDPCLPRTKLCDGRKDCPGGWDEGEDLCHQPCPQTSSTCAASEFQCSNGECIQQSWRCDYSPDCSDASDEVNCDQNECEVNNGGCSHDCVDQPMGFLCDCPANMRLVGDSHCEEINMCLESDVCDQFCHEGYQTTPATGECKAKGDAALLAFSTSKGMRWINITGTEYGEVASHLPGPGPVAAWAPNRTLYWAPQGRGSIYRVSMDGKPQDAVLVLKAQAPVSGLAVDWIHHLLYWTSMGSGSVHVGLLDGSAQRLLIRGLDKPSAVAVEPLL